MQTCPVVCGSCADKHGFREFMNAVARPCPETSSYCPSSHPLAPTLFCAGPGGGDGDAHPRHTTFTPSGAPTRNRVCSKKLLWCSSGLTSFDDRLPNSLHYPPLCILTLFYSCRDRMTYRPREMKLLSF